MARYRHSLSLPPRACLSFTLTLTRCGDSVEYDLREQQPGYLALRLPGGMQIFVKTLTGAF